MTKEEIISSKEKSIYLIEEDKSLPIGVQFTKNSPGVSVVDKKLFTDHFEKYEFFKVNSPNRMGQYFLYEKLLDGRYKSNKPHDHQLFYPKLGVYINSLPCDQTIEVEWVDYRRTWEWRLEYDYQHEGKDYKNYMGELPTEIERLPLWNDYLLIYGVWDSMPTWKQLRQAYERTWWFHRTTDELRNLQLDRLLK
jgi:hypothetical protein